MKYIAILIIIMSTLTYKPIIAEQRQILEDSSPTLLVWGQGGSGKTDVGAAKAIVVGSMHPNNIIFLIRRKKVDLRATLWKRFKEKMPDDFIEHRNENEMIYTAKNGTEYWGLGLDSALDVNKIASTECGMAIVEEATELDEEYFDEKLKRSVRLPRVPFHQTLLMCNPASPSHWIYKKWFIEKSKGYKGIFCKTLPQYDDKGNKTHYLPDSFYDWMNGLTGVFGQRYREGKWVGLEGLAYPFDPLHHVIKRFKIPPEWERVFAIDFGFAINHPFVAQWWAISPEGKWYMYREIYMSQRTVKKHSLDIIKYCNADGIKPQAYCDHDAEDRATLEENNIIAIPAEKDRLAGQQSVQELFDANKIFFLEDSLVEPDIDRQIRKLPTMTVQEFGTYIWLTKGKEDMIKQKDDGMDTMRYAIHTYKAQRRMAPYEKMAGVERGLT